MTYLIIIGGNYCSIRELPASKRLQGLFGRGSILILEVDLAHSGGLSAATRRAWDLQGKNFAILGAFLHDVFNDF